MAEALLQSGDSQVRFFGALTFMIKIKLDWQVYFRAYVTWNKGKAD